MRLNRIRPLDVRGWQNNYARFQTESVRFWANFQCEVIATQKALAPAKENLPVQHAFVMLCFGQIDGLSQWWRGGKAWDQQHNRKKNKRWTAQTQRMASFMEHYMGIPQSTARLAVEMYRHTLMHEGRPRPLLDTRDRLFMWYLCWQSNPSDHLRVRQHVTMPNHLLECGVLNLVDDVQQAINGYTADLLNRATVQREYRRLYEQRWDERLT